MAYKCPVCGYPELVRDPRTAVNGGSYEICASCGFQFGVSDDDLGYTYDAWRAEWAARGMQWASVAVPQPDHWDPAAQLRTLPANIVTPTVQ
jgi:hypothetical protein